MYIHRDKSVLCHGPHLGHVHNHYSAPGWHLNVCTASVRLQCWQQKLRFSCGRLWDCLTTHCSSGRRSSVPLWLLHRHPLLLQGYMSRQMGSFRQKNTNISKHQVKVSSLEVHHSPKRTCAMDKSQLTMVTVKPFIGASRLRNYWYHSELIVRMLTHIPQYQPAATCLTDTL